jgi:hypothetical protein
MSAVQVEESNNVAGYKISVSYAVLYRNGALYKNTDRVYNNARAMLVTR